MYIYVYVCFYIYYILSFPFKVIDFVNYLFKLLMILINYVSLLKLRVNFMHAIILEAPGLTVRARNNRGDNKAKGR